jgi:adenylylsulfate reductase subunit B
MPPLIDHTKCMKCGICAQICGLDVFGPYEEKTFPVVAYGNDCWHCNSCVLDCPAHAITLRLPLSMPLLHTRPPVKNAI